MQTNGRGENVNKNDAQRCKKYRETHHCVKNSDSQK